LRHRYSFSARGQRRRKNYLYDFLLRRCAAASIIIKVDSYLFLIYRTQIAQFDYF
jgi:hypothetical protein